MNSKTRFRVFVETFDGQGSRTFRWMLQPGEWFTYGNSGENTPFLVSDRGFDVSPITGSVMPPNLDSSVQPLTPKGWREGPRL